MTMQFGKAATTNGTKY